MGHFFKSNKSHTFLWTCPATQNVELTIKDDIITTTILSKLSLPQKEPNKFKHKICDKSSFTAFQLNYCTLSTSKSIIHNMWTHASIRIYVKRTSKNDSVTSTTIWVCMLQIILISALHYKLLIRFMMTTCWKVMLYIPYISNQNTKITDD